MTEKEIKAEIDFCNTMILWHADNPMDQDDIIIARCMQYWANRREDFKLLL